MKIKEYQDMMKWLTRPEKPKSDMEIQVKKSVENNKNPGTFQKLVKEDEKQAKQKSSKENKQLSFPGMEPQKKKDVFDGLANNFVKNYNLYDADPGGEMVINNNGQIMMESELKKQFEKEELKKEETKYLKSVYPEKATPEQVGKLAENLERQKQMTKTPTKPIKKIKKISTPIQIDPSIPSVTTLNSSKIQDQVTKVPEARSTVSVENDPRFRNTIFGSDTYWRRKRGL